MTIGVPIVACLPRLYQPCTNSVPKTVKRQCPPNTQSPAAASSTLEEWTRTFSRGQQCTVVLELPYSTEFERGCAAI